MAIDTIAGLKTKMPLATASGTSVSDVHDLIDTFEDRTSQALISISSAYGVNVLDNRRRIVVSAASAVTITLPNTTPAGFELLIVQISAGAGVVAVTGGTLLSKDNHTRTSGQYAVAYLLCLSNAGTSPQIVLTGDTAP